jgi:hypothetical protein
MPATVGRPRSRVVAVIEEAVANRPELPRLRVSNVWQQGGSG